MTNFLLVLLFAIGCHAFRYAPYDQQGRYTRPGYRRPLGEVPNIFKPNNDKEFSNFFNSDSKGYGLGNHVNYGQTQSYGHNSGYGGYSQQKKNPSEVISGNLNQLRNEFNQNLYEFQVQSNFDSFKSGERPIHTPQTSYLNKDKNSHFPSFRSESKAMPYQQQKYKNNRFF